MFDIELESKKARTAYALIRRNFTMKKAFFALIVKPTVQRDMMLNFLREGRPASGRLRWAPLAASTQRSRKKLGFPPQKPILIREGEVYRAATNPIVVSAPNGVRVTPNASGNLLKIMTALHSGIPKREVNAYGQVKGGAAVGGRLPPRPFFFISKQSVKHVVRRLSMFLVGKRA